MNIDSIPLFVFTLYAMFFAMLYVRKSVMDQMLRWMKLQDSLNEAVDDSFDIVEEDIDDIKMRLKTIEDIVDRWQTFWKALFYFFAAYGAIAFLVTIYMFYIRIRYLYGSRTSSHNSRMAS